MGADQSRDFKSYNDLDPRSPSSLPSSPTRSKSTQSSRYMDEVGAFNGDAGTHSQRFGSTSSLSGPKEITLRKQNTVTGRLTSVLSMGSVNSQSSGGIVTVNSGTGQRRKIPAKTLYKSSSLLFSSAGTKEDESDLFTGHIEAQLEHDNLRKLATFTPLICDSSTAVATGGHQTRLDKQLRAKLEHPMSGKPLVFLISRYEEHLRQNYVSCEAKQKLISDKKSQIELRFKRLNKCIQDRIRGNFMPVNLASPNKNALQRQNVAGQVQIDLMIKLSKEVQSNVTRCRDLVSHLEQELTALNENFRSISPSMALDISLASQ